MKAEKASYVIDVVCGAVIDPNETLHRSEHEDAMYAFCSVSCQRVFDDDPDKYLRTRAYGSYH